MHFGVIFGTGITHNHVLKNTVADHRRRRYHSLGPRLCLSKHTGSSRFQGGRPEEELGRLRFFVQLYGLLWGLLFTIGAQSQCTTVRKSLSHLSRSAQKRAGLSRLKKGWEVCLPRVVIIIRPASVVGFEISTTQPDLPAEEIVICAHLVGHVVCAVRAGCRIIITTAKDAGFSRLLWHKSQGDATFSSFCCDFPRRPATFDPLEVFPIHLPGNSRFVNSDNSH